MRHNEFAHDSGGMSLFKNRDAAPLAGARFASARRHNAHA